MDYLAAALEVKAVQAQQRIISGFAAGIGNTDRVQDVIVPGAFSKTLASKAPGDVAVFIGHKTDSLPVGIPLVIREQAGGLYTETLIKPGPAGDDLLATAEFLQRHGKALGMSVGYRVHPGGATLERGRDGKMLRKLTSIDLVEFSYAAAQSIANEQALVTGVKAMHYRVEARGDAFVVLDANDEVEGTYPTRDAAAAAIRKLMRQGDEADMPGPMGKTLDGEVEGKAVWTTAYVNSLPDSSFLFIESGGEKDTEGKTVPRDKRHFPYKDASGGIDAAHLRNAIGRIPQSDAPGLDKAALQGRARRMLANLDGGSKTLDADTPEWQGGAVPRLYDLGQRLAALAETVAVKQASMRDLDLDLHAGQVLRPDHCAALREILAEAKSIADTAEMINTGAYDRGRAARWRQELDLLELAV